MTDFTQAIPVLPEPDWHAVAGIPIVDAGTPLEALGLSREFSVWPAYHKLGIPHAIPECHARGEVFERLLRVAAALPDGVRLVVLDAWRPFAVQQYLYDSLSSALAAHYPRAGEAELERLTRQFVSPPSSSREAPSPHLTGGAVDVTLCDAQGRWLDMGSAFDEAVPASYTAYFERLAEPDTRQRRVRDHRRLLYHAMLDAGFSNLPSEWWHYDFGDQLWAWHTGATQALFGPVQLQAMDALWRQQLQKRPPAD
ncbi:M15 family metallopeptidase [Pseudomonas aeruginosa]|nr:M15 family metallopeptidase [Pseudomonas aeruginosa]